MRDRMFPEITKCQRCGKSLFMGSCKSFIMSWFTEEYICTGENSCHSKEVEIKKAMREQGKEPLDYEGCGYIPTVKNAVDFVKK